MALFENGMGAVYTVYDSGGETVKELKEGVQLSCITCLPNEEGQAVYVVAARGAAEIVVVEQHGQTSMVPWAKVTRHDGSVALVNLANAESVEFAIPQEARP